MALICSQLAVIVKPVQSLIVSHRSLKPCSKHYATAPYVVF